ncbi:MAG: hypothetical protein NC299_13440 [Lachnospiraceae bacterium]|nr:hypothetical protein [Ruminococcus sp.]MCM1276340.1 hypothetical protein [Lachnospiraceae bacterium]
MENEAKITLGGEEYPLLLSTRAVREIGKKFGGLEKLGDELTAQGNADKALDNVVWLIALLANQPILIHNRANKGSEKPLLTVEDVELMTTPADLGEMNGAIKTAIERGSSRSIVSEKQKNA